jgi:hypothetical protein
MENLFEGKKKIFEKGAKKVAEGIKNKSKKKFRNKSKKEIYQNKEIHDNAKLKAESILNKTKFNKAETDRLKAEAASKHADRVGGHIFKKTKKAADGSMSQISIGKFGAGSKDASKLIKAAGFGLGAGGGVVGANKIVKNSSKKKTSDNKKIK